MSEREPIDIAYEALRQIAEHRHKDDCSGATPLSECVCADDFSARDIARRALVQLGSEEYDR